MANSFRPVRGISDRKLAMFLGNHQFSLEQLSTWAYRKERYGRYWVAWAVIVSALVVYLLVRS